MLAIQIRQYGAADALVTADVPRPAPGPDDVLVRVRAAGVNRLDLLLREGRVFQVPLPRIPGTDFSGEIVATGANVPGERVGERVFAAPILSCGACAHCLAGEDNLCAQFGTVGSSIDGGYAQFARLPARNALRLPDGLDAVTGASFALTYATAAAMLRRGRLAAGEWVLVLGANGGLGYAAVELARLQGARVIAASRDAAAAPALQAAGAEAVLPPGPGLPEAVRAITEGQGVALAFEHVAAATFAHSLSALRPGGRLVLGGVTTGTEAPLDLKAVFTRRLEVLGCRGSGRRDLDRVTQLVDQGALRPKVQRVLPLQEAVLAHRLLEAGGMLGKIVLSL